MNCLVGIHFPFLRALPQLSNTRERIRIFWERFTTCAWPAAEWLVECRKVYPVFSVYQPFIPVLFFSYKGESSLWLFYSTCMLKNILKYSLPFKLHNFWDINLRLILGIPHGCQNRSALHLVAEAGSYISMLTDCYMTSKQV